MHWKTKLTALNRLRLKKTVDEILGITWYKQPYFEHFNWDNGISIYLGDNGAQQWLRLKMSYGSDNWIFFENAYLSYDGNTIEVFFDESDDKKTKVGNYTNFGWANRVMVSEWIDVPVTESVEKFLREFAKSPNAKMRLSGKYTKTRLITDSERKGIVVVLNAYDVFINAAANID